MYSILGWAIFLGFQLAFRERPGCELKSVVIDRLVGGAEGRHCCRVRCTPAGGGGGAGGLEYSLNPLSLIPPTRPERFNECAPGGAPVVASLRVPSATKSDPLNLYPVNPVCGQPTEIEPYFSVGNCQMGFYN